MFKWEGKQILEQSKWSDSFQRTEEWTWQLKIINFKRPRLSSKKAFKVELEQKIDTLCQQVSYSQFCLNVKGQQFTTVSKWSRKFCLISSLFIHEIASTVSLVASISTTFIGEIFSLLIQSPCYLIGMNRYCQTIPDT